MERFLSFMSQRYRLPLSCSRGLIEGINSLVQAAKAKARGYRTLRNLAAIT